MKNKITNIYYSAIWIPSYKCNLYFISNWISWRTTYIYILHLSILSLNTAFLSRLSGEIARRYPLTMPLRRRSFDSCRGICDSNSCLVLPPHLLATSYIPSVPLESLHLLSIYCRNLFQVDHIIRNINRYPGIIWSFYNLYQIE